MLAPLGVRVLGRPENQPEMAKIGDQEARRLFLTKYESIWAKNCMEREGKRKGGERKEEERREGDLS